MPKVKGHMFIKHCDFIVSRLEKAGFIVTGYEPNEFEIILELTRDNKYGDLSMEDMRKLIQILPNNASISPAGSRHIEKGWLGVSISND